MFETLRQDIRYAIRSLARRPVITGVAVLSLALGIGVNTAIFSAFDQFLLRRLPAPAPEELVLITSPGPRPGGSSTNNSGAQAHVFSYPLFRDLEGLENTGLSRIAAHRDFAANLSYGGQNERTQGLLVSGGFFSTLGLQPALGRLLTPDDDRTLGGHPVVVLAYSFWERRFGADPRVIDDTLTVNGEPMTIVGVTPPSFAGPTLMEAEQVYVPLTMAERMRARNDMQRRNDHWLYLIGRLSPGVRRDQAEARTNLPFTALIRDVEYPAQRSGLGSDQARQQFLARQVVLEDGSHQRYRDRDEMRLVMVLLLSVTGLVLLIACANLANLMLARAADRAVEIGVRLSIGASAGRIIRLFTTEAALLGFLGAIVGVIVGRVVFNAILSLLPPDDAAAMTFVFNRSMLLFTLALGFGTTLVFGLVPALHMLRTTGIAGMQAGAGRTSHVRSTARFRTSLAIAQIALATALLAEAGLFIISLTNIASLELGIRREGLITFRVSPYLNGYTPERTQGFVDRVEEQLRGVSGVVGVTTSSQPVLAGSNSGRNVTVEGFTAGPDDDTGTSFAAIGADYFRTVGIPLLAGREFSRADAAPTARPVAVVNEAFARKFRLTEPLGRRLAIGAGDNRPLDIEIVGLVRDAKYSDAKTPPPPQLFVPLRPAGTVVFYVRGSGDARQLLAVVPGLVRGTDPNLPVERLLTMDDQIWDNVTLDRVLATLSTWFAGLATLLAAIGLYALLAYTVTQRFREIGIRMALGAKPGDVGRLVLGHVGRIAAIGGVIGLVAALGLGRLGRTLLFGVEGSDPAVIVGAIVGMAFVAFAAAAFPTRRATKVDPVIALRAE